MKKRVNIYPRGPVTTTNPPIRMPVINGTKDIKDIRRCIIAGARVEEICRDGRKVELNLNNYCLDNDTIHNDEEAVKVQLNNIMDQVKKDKEKMASEAPVEESKPEPVVEELVIEAVEEPAPVEEPIVEEETPVVEEEVPAEEPKAEETASHQHLTRKQRRALKAAEAKATTATVEPAKEEAEEQIETMDIEEVL